VAAVILAVNGLPPVKDLWLAVAVGDIAEVERHFRWGVDVHARERWGKTPLHQAACYSKRDMIEWLIARGADVNARNTGHMVGDIRVEAGVTALHDAALTGNVEAAEALIAKGADIGAKGDFGETPLHEASWQGLLAMARLLVDKGADVNATNIAGATPLKRALAGARQRRAGVFFRGVEHEAVAELLRRHGAKE